MKKIVTFILSLIAVATCHAQINYVLNPSFEDHTGCPLNLDNIKQANYWQPIDSVDSEPYCAPEFLHACAINNALKVPGPPVGISYHHYARTGEGMAQAIIFYNEQPSTQHLHRDYLQGHLHHALTAGQSYCVTFYVFEYGVYAIDHVGAYFDNGNIDTATNSYCAWEQTEYYPQILELTFINDTTTDSLGWHKIEGTFTATGDERFITIGNFFDKAHTNYFLNVDPNDTFGMYLNGGYSWILVDDVSVIASNSLPHAGNDTTIHAGDSAFIGPHEIALPYYWYAQGGTSPIDSGGGIFVHPDTTTTYILQQTLCGLNTYDTVKVTVIPADTTGNPDTTNSVGNIVNNYAIIYPNPAQQAVTISNIASGTEIRLFNIIGQQILPATITSSSRQILDISKLPGGTYILQLQKIGNIIRKKIMITR